MKKYLAHVSAVAWKDIVLEVRSREIIIAISIFCLLSIIIFNFALSAVPQTATLVAPGILWVSLSFGGIIGLIRIFALESESNAMDAILLSPISRDALFFGKVLSTFVFMFFSGSILVPIATVIFNVDFPIFPFVVVATLAILGISVVGTLFSAIAVNTRAREVMLPVLYLPVIVPIIIASVECTSTLFNGGGMPSIIGWVVFLAVFDAVYLAIAPLCFSIIVSD